MQRLDSKGIGSNEIIAMTLEVVDDILPVDEGLSADERWHLPQVLANGIKGGISTSEGLLRNASLCRSLRGEIKRVLALDESAFKPFQMAGISRERSRLYIRGIDEEVLRECMKIRLTCTLAGSELVTSEIVELYNRKVQSTRGRSKFTPFNQFLRVLCALPTLNCNDYETLKVRLRALSEEQKRNFIKGVLPDASQEQIDVFLGKRGFDLWNFEQ